MLTFPRARPSATPFHGSTAKSSQFQSPRPRVWSSLDTDFVGVLSAVAHVAVEARAVEEARCNKKSIKAVKEEEEEHENQEVEEEKEEDGRRSSSIRMDINRSSRSRI